MSATKASGSTASKRDARGRVRRGRNAGRPKPKTAAELDAEMADYFGDASGVNNTTSAANGAAQLAANGEDLGMDEISVCN